MCQSNLLGLGPLRVDRMSPGSEVWGGVFGWAKRFFLSGGLWGQFGALEELVEVCSKNF